MLIAQSRFSINIFESMVNKFNQCSKEVNTDLTLKSEGKHCQGVYILVCCSLAV